jgi:hypothetical protein
MYTYIYIDIEREREREIRSGNNPFPHESILH